MRAGKSGKRSAAGALSRSRADRPARVVVKVGGSLAREPGLLHRIMRVLAGAEPLPLVVPGGGALADGVRLLYQAGGLSEATAHRMALLALDQQALWLLELAGGDQVARVVRSRPELDQTWRQGRLPVLAPADWLVREEAAGLGLPASWDVTSDSIAAWAAGQVGAQRLFLLKAFSFRSPEIEPAELGDSVDRFFLRVLPKGLECRFLDGREPELLEAALASPAAGGTLLRRVSAKGLAETSA